MTLTRLIEAKRQESFVQPELATDEDALGLLIAHHFKWDGLAILRAAAAALEDANFHDEAARVSDMAARYDEGSE